MKEMQFTNATAAMIARSATSLDEICGDGTTTNVILIGEFLKQAARYISEGLHPRLVVEGFEAAKNESLNFLESFKVHVDVDSTDAQEQQKLRNLLLSVAKTSLRTKVPITLADKLTEAVVEALLSIRQAPGQPIDLFMVEIMKMQHFSALDTTLVKGLVLDHGARHPGMPKFIENAFILNLNVSLEYEKTEINSGFFYSSAAQRDELVASERKFIDDRVLKIIELKRKVCPPGSGKGFVVVNQKGIDPNSLEMLATEGIFALRRAKRRNAERIQLICGGVAQNSVQDLTEAILGFAGSVKEQAVGEDKYTFIEGTANPKSVTILIKAPTTHLIAQIHDAIRDGLRAVNNVLEDKAIVPGAGAFQVALAHHLHAFKNKAVQGKAKLGCQAFIDAMLVIPKTLAQNAGFDSQDCLVALQDAYSLDAGAVAVNLEDGGVADPVALGIWDNYRVHRNILHSSTVISSNLLLVDEIMRAGRSSLKNEDPEAAANE
jgi:T-complex protein 1 subunit zeta